MCLILQVKEFDSISRLDQWQTTMLLRIKKTIQGDSGDLKWCVPQKYCGIISSLISYRIVCVCDNLVEHFCSDTSSNISRFLESSNATCIAFEKTEVYRILIWIKAFLYPFTSPWGNLSCTLLFVLVRVACKTP